MTHKTGNRPEVVQELVLRLKEAQASMAVHASFSEMEEAFYLRTVEAHRRIMGPIREDAECPTCKRKSK